MQIEPIGKKKRENTAKRPKHRLKAAICFAENFPCHHVALAARDIREYSNQNFEQVRWPTSSKAPTGHDTSQRRRTPLPFG